MNLRFSVVIPALNEEKLLPRLLEAIKNQTFKNFEAILVDANSKDRTIEEAEKFQRTLTLTIIHTSEKNISRSRNIGAAKAKGEYIFFIDSDNYVHPAFLKEIDIVLGKNYEMIIPSVTPDSKNLYTKLPTQQLTF